MTPEADSASVASTPEASTPRGAWSPAASALSAISCQEVSTGRACCRASARKAPAPGRVTTSPSAASSASARETVTGLTRCRSTRARLDGSFSPGE
ncbi:hypothetical protein SRIMM317S_01403 [Streptomyces rimosus subsp. rimosus]